MKHKQNAATVANQQQHPGAGYTMGRDQEQDRRLEKQYTRSLNNNPRSDSNQV